MKSYYLLIITTILVILHTHCSDPQLAGGGLDTESSGGKLIGMVVESQNDKIEHTVLQLIPIDYSPINKTKIYQSEADKDGSFIFTDINIGTYNLQAQNPQTGTKLLYKNINVVTIDDSIQLDMLTLKQPGTIYINIGSTLDSNCIIYIPGTNISLFVKQLTDTLKIDSIPAGHIPPIHYSDKVSNTGEKLTDSIVLKPSQTLHLSSYVNWTHSMRISIDTSKSTIQPTSESFPIYIELDETIFNFKESSSDGSDIRFSNHSNNPIPFEIEVWDTLKSKASIWIKLDSMSHISPPNFVTMFWGNSVSKPASDGASVFSKAQGYRGVYHLNEEKVGVKNRNIYIDVSGSDNNGYDNIADRSQTDWLGYAKHFDSDEEDYIQVDPLNGCNNGSGPFTISFWFNSDYQQKSTLFSWYFDIIDSLSIGVTLDSSNTIALNENSKPLIKSNESFKIKKWNYVCITRSPSEMLTLYLNGKKQASKPFSQIFDNTIKSTLIIGADISVVPEFKGTQTRSFNGYFDEFRIELTERENEYIHNSYTTQLNQNLFNFSQSLSN